MPYEDSAIGRFEPYIFGISKENRPIYQIAKTGQKRCSKYIVSYDNMWEKGKTSEAGDAGGGGAVSIMNSQIPQASDSKSRDEAAIRAILYCICMRLVSCC